MNICIIIFQECGNEPGEDQLYVQTAEHLSLSGASHATDEQGQSSDKIESY